MPNDLVSQLRELANTTNRGVCNQIQNTFLANEGEKYKVLRKYDIDS